MQGHTGGYFTASANSISSNNISLEIGFNFGKQKSYRKQDLVNRVAVAIVECYTQVAMHSQMLCHGASYTYNYFLIMHNFFIIKKYIFISALF